MITKKTNRGFSYIDFNDSYGQKCSIQESSNVVPHLWLGVETDLAKEEVDARMHLNRKQVKNLIKTLSFWVENEHLKKDNIKI